VRRLRFRFPWRRAGQIGHDVDDELRFHFESRAAELIASGLTPERARAQAEREFGDLGDARAYMNAIDRDAERRRRRRDHMDDLMQDIAYAFRMLRSAPAFTVAALVTLALGIGANTAIFSVVNGVLLKPLPFPQPDRLVRLWLANPKTGERRSMVSAVDVDDWRDQRQAFADIGGYFFMDGLSGSDLTGSGEPERVSIAYFSPGFFSTMGVAPLVGRAPRDDEAVRGGRDHVVTLSYGFWQRRFGGSRSVIDSTITLGSEPYQVIGVMPPGFSFPDPRAEAWVPYSSIPDVSIPRLRQVATMVVVGRLKPGLSAAQGLADLNVITARLAQQYPQSNASWGGGALVPLQESITGTVSGSLYVLLAAVAFLMLMACVNVASLLLARATAREREIAVRMALGAGRGRIVRQLVTESLVLAAAGGAAGVLLARIGLSGLLSMTAGQMPRANEVRLDWQVLVFAVALSLATGLLFGLVPALRATTGRLHESIREGGRGSVGGRSRLRTALVVTQVALATVLVVGAGLMTKSFLRLLDVDAGFDPGQRVAVMFTINTTRHPRYQQLYRDVIDKVRTVPGVIEAAAVRDAPFRGAGENWSFAPPGWIDAPGKRLPAADVNFISDGYLHTIGARLVAGREFAHDEVVDSSAVPVVVNEALARRWLPDGRAVGSELRIGAGRARVIGVVADLRQTSLEKPAEPAIYVDNMMQSRVKTTVIARVTGDPMAAARAIREAIWSLDRDMPISDIFTLDRAMSDAAARPRLLTVLLGAFGVLGLVLGAVGIYGVLAFLVSRRRREIGVRLALGAAPGSVNRMIVGRGLALAGGGIAIGVVAALALGQFLRGVLYGVTPRDPATLAGVVVVLAAAAWAASWLPARRASRVDPAVALRAE
jgi:predicted permease